MSTGLFVALALAAAAAPVMADPIDPQHPVYRFLRRAEVLGLLPVGFTEIRPRDREEIVAALTAMQPTCDDSTTLRRYLNAFSWRNRQRESRWVHTGDEMQGGLRADFIGSATLIDSMPKYQAYSTGIFAVEAAGQYRDHLSAISQAFLGMERSRVDRFRENYDPALGLPYNTDREGKAGKARGVATFDGFRTVLSYGQGPLRIEAGQDWNVWGPGIFSQTTLGATPWFWVQDSLAASDTVGFAGTRFSGGYRRGFREPGEASPLPQIRLRFSAGKFEYVKIVAQRTGLDVDSAAWLVSHRLVWKPTPRLAVAGVEMVNLAGRTPDMGYWLPGVPLKYAEHQFGDRDNIAIGFDVAYALPWSSLVHAEILLDDFSGFPLDFWGNKFAVTTGLSLGRLGPAMTWLGRSEADLEYSWVGPWVFTHLRRDTQMQSYGALLGSALPADAQRLTGRWVHHWSPSIDWMTQGYVMQRSVGTRPVSPFSVHVDSLDGNRRHLLAGPVETRASLGLGSALRWASHAELELWVGSLWVSTWKGEIGRDLQSPWFNGKIRFSY